MSQASEIKTRPDGEGWWRIRDKHDTTLHFHRRQDGKVRIFGGNSYMWFDWFYKPDAVLQCVKVTMPGP